MKIKTEFMLVDTSVDDLRSSLALMNPTTDAQIESDAQILRENISYESRNKNRSTVIKMLQVKLENIYR